MSGPGARGGDARSPAWNHAREIAFGFLTALFSSFGQTFFVSLFLVAVVPAMGISDGFFGLLYSLATLAAGLALPVFGKWLDARTERTALWVAGGGLVVSLVLFSVSAAWWVLVVALFGMRAFGQGAMSLLSSASMARYFNRRRGLALGIAGMGYSFGEMILPAATLAAIAALGWRSTALLCAALLAGALVFVGMKILVRPLRVEGAGDVPTRPAPARGSRFQWWREPVFLLAMLVTVVMPFGGTVVLLYLLPVAGSKGWPSDWVAVGFVLFAVVRGTVSLLVGPVIDRLGALRIFPWTILPFAVAMTFLLSATSPWVGLGFFVSLGLAFGTGPALTALLADTYGPDQIGEIRGLATSAMVLSSAMGPFAAGWAIGIGHPFASLLAVLLALGVMCFVAAFGVAPLARKRNIRHPQA